MLTATRNRLLALNREFYERVADSFHDTRRSAQPGLLHAVEFVPRLADRAPRLLDVGCGNGRFARILDEWSVRCDYVGLDGSAALLAHARADATTWSHVEARFVRADLAEPNWAEPLAEQLFDAVTCFATMHHLPSQLLRQRVVANFAALLAPDAPLILSFWQFLDDDRLASKRLPWASAGLSKDDVEPGDALLPWQQSDAIRYAHHVDEDEARSLAEAANLFVTDCYYADGKSGRLGMYLVMKRGT